MPVKEILVLAVMLLVSPTECQRSKELTGHLVQDVVSQHIFGTHHYNFVACGNQDSDITLLLKRVSSAFHGLLGVHDVADDVHSWVSHSRPQTFILDMNCPGALQVLVQGNLSNLFHHPNTWLLLLTDSHEAATLEMFLLNLSIYADSQVIIFKRTGQWASQLVSMYKIAPRGDFVWENLGSWTLENGLDILVTKPLAVRRANLRGLSVNAVIVVTHDDSLNHMEDFVDKHIDGIAKMSVTLVGLATATLNASLNLILVDSWGSRAENGTWSGMVGQIQSGAAEVLATPLFITPERMEILQYVSVTYPVKFRFIFISPPLSYSSNIFSLPFSSIVWISCFGLMFLACLLLYSIVRLESPYYESRYDSLRGSWSDIIMLAVSAVCIQGTPVEPKAPAGRIVTLFIFLSVMFFYVAYSASIVSLLQSSDTSINTLADLLESPLGCGADDIVYSQYYFKTATEPIRKAIYEKKIASKGGSPKFFSVEEGMARVRRGLFAFHVDTSAGYYIVQETFGEEEKCGLQELRIAFINQAQPMVAVRRHSSINEMYRIRMLLLFERGHYPKYAARYCTNKPVCSSRASKFVSVGLMDCFHAFLWLTYGMLLSLGVLLLERLVYVRNQNRSPTTMKSNNIRHGRQRHQ